MSRSRRARNLKHDVPNIGHIRRRPKEKNEEGPIPDLWEVPGARLPGNPRATRHEPEYTYVVDATGERVCVIEAKVVKFRASSVGIETIRKLRRVQSANRLWTGPPHHVLTNALRLLQSCTVTKYVKGEDIWYIRTGITPAQLLRQTGLAPARTDEILARLAREGLLVHRGRQNGPWLVNMRVKGFDTEGQKYEAHDLVEGWALPDLPEEKPDMQRLEAKRLAELMTRRGLRENRHEVLNAVYAVVAKYVPANPEREDGYAVFTTPEAITSLVARELGITQGQAGGALQDLLRIGVYKSKMVGAGRWKRYLVLDAGPFTEDHVEQSRVSRGYRRKDLKDVALLGNRYIHLMDAYQILLETVPVDAEPDAKGFVEYNTDYSFNELVSQRLTDVSSRTAQRLLTDLSALGVLSTKPLRSGGRRRRLKLGVKRFTEKDVKRIGRVGRKRPEAVRAPVQKPVVPASAGPDQLKQLLIRMDERIETLKRELEVERKAHALTRAELETARAASVEIPAELVKKYL